VSFVRFRRFISQNTYESGVANEALVEDLLHVDVMTAAR
jgi:hypothetical protein